MHQRAALLSVDMVQQVALAMPALRCMGANPTLRAEVDAQSSDVSGWSRGGRNLRFGVCQHEMGAIFNS